MLIMKSKIALLFFFSLTRTIFLPADPTVADDQKVDDVMSTEERVQLFIVEIPFVFLIPNPNIQIIPNVDELSIMLTSNPTHNNNSSAIQMSNPTVNSLGLSHSIPSRNITDDTAINHLEEDVYSDEERSLASVDDILNHITSINPLVSPLDEAIHNPIFNISDKCDKCESQKEKCNCSS
ncbi:hypothetical protein TUBRATIS_009800 [Tubulinosema ratisbonensis]|uniref:Uncharacterized protein n=1 Tax=Tubulinosema ratisbonensis TaxID=291195 RepID=A0A437AMR9_9MICR|nr:hypothetical protein TUBRATIS_009800 [Tubulinosema ratisbonensis]